MKVVVGEFETVYERRVYYDMANGFVLRWIGYYCGRIKTVPDNIVAALDIIAPVSYREKLEAKLAFLKLSPLARLENGEYNIWYNSGWTIYKNDAPNINIFNDGLLLDMITAIAGEWTVV